MVSLSNHERLERASFDKLRMSGHRGLARLCNRPGEPPGIPAVCYAIRYNCFEGQSLTTGRATIEMNQRRYEKEIEEILRKAGDGPQQAPPPEPGEPGGPPRRRRGASVARRASMRRLRADYKVLLLGGFVLLIVSYAASNAFVFLASLALLVAGYVVYYRAPRSSGGGGGSYGSSAGPKMWRGRPIDPDDPPNRGRRR